MQMFDFVLTSIKSVSMGGVRVFTSFHSLSLCVQVSLGQRWMRHNIETLNCFHSDNIMPL